jgi:TusA-related sulfurtransferase
MSRDPASTDEPRPDEPRPDEQLSEQPGDFDLIGVTPAATLDVSGMDPGPVLLMLRNAVARVGVGDVVEVAGGEDALSDELTSWCRLNGCTVTASLDAGIARTWLLRKGPAAPAWEQPDWGIRLPRREGGRIDLRDWFQGRAGQVPDVAPTYYGFVPRGAVAEPGMPPYPFTLNAKADVWADNIAGLYEQAKAQQWNASEDIPWDQLPALPDDMERAVCQIMTFLAENEYLALYIPAKFLPRINATFVEPVMFLATIINDEARHIEVFTKRALANGGGLQYAAAMTEWSLQSLLLQEDYFRSSFLLHVLGEGTFLDLLAYIERHAPDPVTAEVVRRSRLDEGRHVAYGIAHVRHQLRADPTRGDELVASAEERSAILQATTGVNPPVLEALTILGGGGSAPEQRRRGTEAVRELHVSMGEYRVRRMLQVGLDRVTAEKISDLHTPNFM